MHYLDYLFHPKSIAVIGVSSNSENWGGGVWPQVLKEMGFTGDVYIVNPSNNQSGNSKIYSNIKDIPGNIDLAIVSVPAAVTPGIITDCAAKGVKIAHIFSAGFRESGDEGSKLEKEIADIAGKTGMRILGPNCMGIYHPAKGLCWRPDFPKECGTLAVISQSGLNASNFLKQAEIRNLRFSKLISYGNACDLNEADFLEYLSSDRETKVITLYIESIKDGRRFFRVIRETSMNKPVIILKGGKTEAGVRVTASHTGSIASSNFVWDSLFKQTGAIAVDSMEELADSALIFTRFPPPKNRRVAIMGPGGGPNVLATDDCNRAGLEIPSFSTKTKEQLYSFTPKAGTSVANPVDIIFSWTPEEWAKAIDIIGNSEEVDMFIIHLGMTFQHLIPNGIDFLKKMSASILDAVINCKIPAAMVIYSGKELETVAREERERFNRAGIPVFPSVTSAAKAIGRLITYHDYLNDISLSYRKP